MWIYPPICRTKVGARWSPSFPRQSLARRRARNIVQVHAHALNGSWECYHVVRIGLGAIWGDHGGDDEVCILPPPTLSEKGWVYPILSISLLLMSVEKEWTDAGRDGRICLARLNPQAPRTEETGKKQFPCSADHEQQHYRWQTIQPVDQYSVESSADYTT